MAKQMQIVSHGMMERSGGWGGRGCVCSVRSPGVCFSFTLLSLLPCDDAFSYTDFVHVLAFGAVQKEAKKLFLWRPTHKWNISILVTSFESGCRHMHIQSASDEKGDVWLWGHFWGEHLGTNRITKVNDLSLAVFAKKNVTLNKTFILNGAKRTGLCIGSVQSSHVTLRWLSGSQHFLSLLLLTSMEKDSPHNIIIMDTYWALVMWG